MSSLWGSKSKWEKPAAYTWTVVKHKVIGNNLVLFAHYPECKTMEGNKILLFKNTTLDDVIHCKTLDPHFSTAKLSPFARFEPTKSGYKAAKLLARLV